MIGAATARPQETHRRKPLPEKRSGQAVVGLERPRRFQAKKPLLLYGGRLGDWALALAGDSCEVAQVKRVAADHLLLRDADGADRRLMEAPALLAGIVGFDKTEFDLMSRAAAWLRRSGAAPEPLLPEPLLPEPLLPEPLLVEAADAPAFAGYLLRNLQRALASQATLNTSLARQLALARQGNEDLQNRFAALEAFIDRHGLQPFDCAFVNPPPGEDHGLGEALADMPVPNVLEMAANGRVSQILPVASLGVSAIALHVARARPRCDATLEIALQSIEDGEVIEQWSVPAGDLPAGWTTLSLRSAVTGLRRTLRLVIAVEGAGGDLPALSLGGAQPLDLFRLQDHDLQQSIAAASLAMRVFVGLPGVVPPGAGSFAPQQGQGREGGLQERPLPVEILRQAHQVQLDPDAGGFDGVTYLDSERILSCHPPAFGMTIARLPAGCLAGALRLSANLLVDHAQARDVEFALVATRDEARVIQLLGGVVEPGAGEGCSGWVRVPARQPRFASLFLAAAGGEPSDLYLATRMVEPGNHDFAWARFLNLHALTRG